ncbi:MAG: TIGR02679 domain-containing protein [Clostridia bacterium]
MGLKSKQLAEYFKSNSGYTRLLKGIKNKYINLGEIKGNVIINNPSELERQVFSGLMKKDYSKNKSISINLKVLTKRLEDTKFQGADLKDTINEYFKEEIKTKKEKNESYEIEIEKFFETILDDNTNTKIYKYLQEIISSKNETYNKLKKYYNKDKEELKKALLNVCKGINNLPNEKIRIPVFASDITGNPHGFDRNTICGKIFIMLLCYIENMKIPRNTEELLEVYYNHNLLIDDVSNMVLCKNIKGYKKEESMHEQSDNKYIKHMGLESFSEYDEPIYLNLYNLSNIAFLEENYKYNEVVVMENPAVFMEVAEKTKNRDFPIVCTYGQVKLSGLILLDMLVRQNYKIYYSGDIDPEGIQIADKLKSRYNDNLYFLGFDINTYRNNLSNVKISNTRLKKLEKIKSKYLKVICEEVNLIKRASYEEKNIEEIVKFIDGR